jgi:hypothetical protein
MKRMQPTPSICKHKGILTHWSGYPEGSVERAKALGIEIWSTSKDLQTTLKLWEGKLAILRREKPWQVLGLNTADDFVKAIVGKTTKEIGKEIAKRTQIRQLREDHPEWTQQRIADEVGVDKAYVSRTLTKPSESDNSVNTPDHLNGHSEKADFRKLPMDMREAVAQKKISLNAAAIQAGIRKRPSQGELCVKAFRKAENRLEVLKLIIAELDEHEIKFAGTIICEAYGG